MTTAAFEAHVLAHDLGRVFDLQGRTAREALADLRDQARPTLEPHRSRAERTDWLKVTWERAVAYGYELSPPTVARATSADAEGLVLQGLSSGADLEQARLYLFSNRKEHWNTSRQGSAVKAVLTRPADVRTFAASLSAFDPSAESAGDFLDRACTAHGWRLNTDFTVLLHMGLPQYFPVWFVRTESAYSQVDGMDRLLDEFTRRTGLQRRALRLAADYHDYAAAYRVLLLLFDHAVKELDWRLPHWDAFTQFLAEVANPRAPEQPSEVEAARPVAPGGSSPLLDALARAGFRYRPHQVACLYGALKAKGFAILTGLSGTGKTRLALLLARALGLDSDHRLTIAVRPDWRDSSGLLGFWNPIAGRFEEGAFLRFLRHAADEHERLGADASPYLVVLDEMNLARVEYYFAEVLSAIESGEAIRLHDRTDPVVPREIRLSPNVYLVGTVNMDETTFTFSPKVLDRAFTIELRDVDLAGYPPAGVFEEVQEVPGLRRDFVREGRFTRFGKAEVANWAVRHARVVEELRSLNDRLEPHDLHFGYRVVDEVLAFVDAVLASPLASLLPGARALDHAVLMKALPKVHGTRHRIEAPLRCVVEWAGDRHEATAAKATRMLERARTLGHASFA